MKKYYMTLGGIKKEITFEQYIKIKTLKTYYELKKKGLKVDYKDLEKNIRKLYT